MWAEISVSETVVSKNSLVVGGVVDGYGGGAGHASGDDGDATVRKSKAAETGRKMRGVQNGAKSLKRVQQQSQARRTSSRRTRPPAPVQRQRHVVD